MHRLLRKSLIVFLALTTRTPSLWAQVLGGKVVDQLSRRPRGYLVVEAFDSVTTVRDTTGKDGTFMLALPYAGAFSLRVHRGGADPIVFPALAVSRDSLVQRVFPVPVGRPYYEFEVDHQSQFARNPARMIYPDSLRQQYVEGEVLAQFVVEASGRVRESSFKALRRTHELFALSVELFLRTAEYTPATINGVAVDQLVQQPFTFSLR
jgi:TonB family protein